MNNFIVPERGDNTVGLIKYLFGPGRYNEHTDQRVIACSSTFGVPDGTRLDYQTQEEEILSLGRRMDSHRKAMGITMPDGHVWHCAISMPPQESTEDRKLTDVQFDQCETHEPGHLRDGPSQAPDGRRRMRALKKPPQRDEIAEQVMDQQCSRTVPGGLPVPVNGPIPVVKDCVGQHAGVERVIELLTEQLSGLADG